MPSASQAGQDADAKQSAHCRCVVSPQVHVNDSPDDLTGRSLEASDGEAPEATPATRESLPAGLSCRYLRCGYALSDSPASRASIRAS
ncbi:hypothetical protein CUJ88_43900 (plasmid) [Paraburkholderia hospita]|nr:hypothetical protein CUJ88_43900 [Paraburkholderia hospita]